MRERSLDMSFGLRVLGYKLRLEDFDYLEDGVYGGVGDDAVAEVEDVSGASCG